MGAITGMLGLGGGAGGTGTQGPQQAVIENPLNPGQAGAQLRSNQDMIAALQAQNGMANQSNIYNQLQGVANGTGPNPAQAMLANQTGANVANQAALMAGQRGAGANAGMMARQAAMQGAATQQQAVGQGAQMQANQSLGALGQMGNIAGQQVGNQIGATQALTGQELNAQSAFNQNQVSSQQSVNSANAQMAAQQQANQGAGIGKLLGAAGTVIGGIYGGPAGALVGGSVGGAAPTLLGGGTAAGGNLLGTNTQLNYAEGGAVRQNPYKSKAAHYFNGGATKKVPSLVSPGERYLSPEEVSKVAKGEKAPEKAGEKIPGKPKVGGDVNSYKNDTVPKTLEEGGIVLPRSVMESKNPHWEAHKFVSQILAKQGKIPARGKK